MSEKCVCVCVCVMKAKQGFITEHYIKYENYSWFEPIYYI